VNISKAAKRAGLEYSTAKSIRQRVGELEVEYAKKGLPPPILEEKVARQEGSRAKPKLTDKDLNKIFVVYILNKKQYKKLQYIVAAELSRHLCLRTCFT
jgi:hypothetical protein